MLQRWRWIIRAAFIITFPLSVGAAIGQDHTPAPKTAKKTVKPHAKTAKSAAKTVPKVKTRQLRARAEQVAKKVRGVRAVKNRLVVK
jgi:hypothetical protein